MPRGKYVNHKGRSRHFTSPEELQQESEDESEQSTGSDDEEEQKGAAGAGTSKQPAASTGAARKPARAVQRQKQQQQRQQRSSSDEESDDDDSDDDSEAEVRDAKKGVAALIEIENPNRVTKKATQKLSQIKIDDGSNSAAGGVSGSGSSSSHKPELSRREREQIEKQKARQRYEKLHAAGKTTEAKADLARLALIRQQREEAAAKREAEKKSVADLSKKPLSK
ncbi:28 kDa heat- and acid-stable phosphoprotein-like [Drosophila hydei]|uniref:28 kDa heat- and acid-stable phosphoprotein-like n=1 Tax=Drosophila hydei TaxID=7224 RepID=A0A6J1MKX4_DROHY|nr:28 kDa heat- and acid-stable phosphoprotein-like [Drosophila hydei]XP_023177701.1 28 kDa heat- and acid-stable phosphoprotein-like [Drosophila hydei]XP_023177703.1 28 kDa heat- and acid-stable phosphoprotein-like [Drosophila hydei]